MLFSTQKINQTTFKNRWIMLALHTGFCKEGVFSQRDLDFYEARARGGAGAITVVAGVEDSGRLSGMHFGTGQAAQESLKSLVERLIPYDCKLIVQLFHCGRNESKEGHGDRLLLAPSPIASTIFRQTPKEMTQEEIRSTIDAFAKAAHTAKAAGAAGVEISASAGYLLSLFFSALTNQRTDGYGEDRYRFAWEVLQAVRTEVGADFPVLIKISGAQMLPGGYTVSDMQAFCQKAETAGLIDAVTVTGGWHESPVEQISYHVPKGGYAYLADAIKRVLSIPVIACNRIHDKKTAQTLLEQGMCDFVGSARGFLCDPDFVNRMEAEAPYNICQSCNHCIQAVLKGREVICAYQPEVGNEWIENSHRRVATQKKVLVLGGGPGGMMAAKKAAERGYKTTLVSKEPKLGGQLNLAKLPPGKAELQAYIDYMEHELKMLDVTIVYGTMDAEEILAWQPYFVVVATGSTPVCPDIPGVDSPHVFMAKEVFEADPSLLARMKSGSTVIVGGGSLGLEIAEFLTEKTMASSAAESFYRTFCSDMGVKVPLDLHVLEKGPRLGFELGGMARPILAGLKQNQVKMSASTQILQIGADFVKIQKGETIAEIPANQVVIAMGSTAADTSFVSRLEDERISYAIIGDAARVGDAHKAIAEAYEIFLRMYIA